MSPPPRHRALPVISRVKVDGKMNMRNDGFTQDGRIQKTRWERMSDLRVSTLTTQYGESLDGWRVCW